MRYLFIATLLILSFYFTSNAQLIIYNGGFDSVTTNMNGDTIPVNWTIQSDEGGMSTTDAYGAPYAVRIYNWNYFVKGELWYGNENGPNHVGMPLLAVPTALNGYYKYVLGSNDGSQDTAEVWVYATLFNHQDGTTDTVATGHHFFAPSADYDNFTVPIFQGADSLVCDTLQIHFISSINGVCDSASNGNCCFLYLDELSIDIPNGVQKINLEQAVPVIVYNADDKRFQLMRWNDKLNQWSIKLMDVTGKTVFAKEGITSTSVTSSKELTAGLYLYNVTIGSSYFTGKVMVMR